MLLSLLTLLRGFISYTIRILNFDPGSNIIISNRSTAPKLNRKPCAPYVIHFCVERAVMLDMEIQTSTFLLIYVRKSEKNLNDRNFSAFNSFSQNKSRIGFKP